MNLCDFDTIQQLLLRHGFKFSKSMGQNFLIDGNVPIAIAEASEADENCGVLEIGPGIGALTTQLARRAGKVVSIELDTICCRYCRRRWQTMTMWKSSPAMHFGWICAL